MQGSRRRVSDAQKKRRAKNPEGVRAEARARYYTDAATATRLAYYDKNRSKIIANSQNKYREKQSQMFSFGVRRRCDWCQREYGVHPNFPTSKFCSASCRASYFIRQQGGKRSSLEVTVEKVLKDAGIPFSAQHRLGKWLIDFYLPEQNIAVEVDGDYWHSLPETVERDLRKDANLRSLGVRVVRLKESDIKASPKAILKELT